MALFASVAIAAGAHQPPIAPNWQLNNLETPSPVTEVVFKTVEIPELTKPIKERPAKIAKLKKRVVKKPVVKRPVATIPTGSHTDWMRRAGIPQSEWAAVDFIISHESGWNPNATNPSSGAHGLPQALPYSKTGCGWSDAVCQLRWADKYAKSAYGGWWPAKAFWVANNWW